MTIFGFVQVTHLVCNKNFNINMYLFSLSGLTPSEAALFHIDVMDLTNDLPDLANNASNPKLRAIQYLFDCWRKERVGGLDEFSITECLKKYKLANPDLTIVHDIHEHSFCVLLITPFMKRIHKMAKESSEIIFVDATSNCDQQNIAVVPVLCASAAGALPLAIAFCSSQDEVMFNKGNQRYCVTVSVVLVIISVF